MSKDNETKKDNLTFRIDMTIYIDAPTTERVDEIVGILQTKLLEVPGIHKLDLKDQ